MKFCKTIMQTIQKRSERNMNNKLEVIGIDHGRSDIDDEYFAIIKAEIEDFVDKVYNSIREFGYSLKTIRQR
jgi:plasmid segregation protein ParM